jgi:integrase
VLHDIRRTVSTWLNGRLNVQPWVVEAVLAHQLKGTQAVYNVSDYFDERKRLMPRWADYVDAVVAGEEAPTVTVVQLRA